MTAVNVQPIRIGSILDVTSFIDLHSTFSGRARTAWFVALAGLFLDAFANASLGSGLGALTKQFGLSATQVGLLTSSSAVVALLFNPLGGWFGDRFGRMRPLIATKFVYLLGVGCMAFASNYEMVLGGRMLVGAAYGIDLSIVLALLAEYTPSNRGSRLNLWSGFWCVAVMANLIITSLFVWYGVGLNIWRYSVGAAAILAIAMLLLQVRFLVESPTWLASAGRLHAAVHSLGRLYPHVSFVAIDVGRIAIACEKKSVDISLPFRGVYLKRSILAASISLCAYLQYNAIGWYLPVISLMLFKGNFIAALLVSIVYNLFGAVGGFTSPWLARRFGLRKIALLGFSIFFVFLIAMGLLDGNANPLVLAIFPAILMVVDFGCVAPTGKTMAALSYRSEVRATGSAFSGFMTNVGGAIGLFVFPVLLGRFSLGTALLILSSVPLIGALVCACINWDPSRNGFSADEERDAPGLKSAAGTDTPSAAVPISTPN